MSMSSHLPLPLLLHLVPIQILHHSIQRSTACKPYSPPSIFPHPSRSYHPPLPPSLSLLARQRIFCFLVFLLPFNRSAYVRSSSMCGLTLFLIGKTSQATKSLNMAGLTLDMSEVATEMWIPSDTWVSREREWVGGGSESSGDSTAALNVLFPVQRLQMRSS